MTVSSTISPPTIAILIASLEAATAKLSEAVTLRQTKARNDVVIRRAVALFDRLIELDLWLHETADDETKTDAYLANLGKYEDGWKALDAAENCVRQYRELHYEELVGERSERGIPPEMRVEAPSPSLIQDAFFR